MNYSKYQAKFTVMVSPVCILHLQFIGRWTATCKQRCSPARWRQQANRPLCASVRTACTLPSSAPARATPIPRSQRPPPLRSYVCALVALYECCHACGPSAFFFFLILCLAAASRVARPPPATCSHGVLTSRVWRLADALSRRSRSGPSHQARPARTCAYPPVLTWSQVASRGAHQSRTSVVGELVGQGRLCFPSWRWEEVPTVSLFEASLCAPRSPCSRGGRAV